MLELILPHASFRKGECCVSASGKFKRILIFKQAYEEMKDHHDNDFQFVHFLADKERPDRFWISRATKELQGSSQIVLNPKNYSSASPSVLIF